MSVAGAQRVFDGADDRHSGADVHHVGTACRSQSKGQTVRQVGRHAGPGPLPGRGHHSNKGAGAQARDTGPVRTAKPQQTHARAQRVLAGPRRIAVRQGAGSIHGRTLPVQGGPLLGCCRPATRLGIIGIHRKHGKDKRRFLIIFNDYLRVCTLNSERF